MVHLISKGYEIPFITLILIQIINFFIYHIIISFNKANTHYSGRSILVLAQILTLLTLAFTMLFGMLLIVTHNKLWNLYFIGCAFVTVILGVLANLTVIYIINNGEDNPKEMPLYLQLNLIDEVALSAGFIASGTLGVWHCAQS